jgi:hypothetical protein
MGQHPVFGPTRRPLHTRVTLSLPHCRYSIRAELDSPLAELLAVGKIYSGLKLCVCGADLKITAASPPLECPDGTRLRIFRNGTRRARWDADLGLQRGMVAFPINLGTVHPKGGNVVCTTFVVERAFPTIFMEKVAGNHRVVRGARGEQEARNEWEASKERLEDICLKDLVSGPDPRPRSRLRLRP